MAQFYLDNETTLYEMDNGLDVTIQRYVDSKGKIASFNIGHEEWGGGYTTDLKLSSVNQLKRMIIGLEEELEDLESQKRQA